MASDFDWKPALGSESTETHHVSVHHGHARRGLVQRGPNRSTGDVLHAEGQPVHQRCGTYAPQVGGLPFIGPAVRRLQGGDKLLLTLLALVGNVGIEASVERQVHQHGGEQGGSHPHRCEGQGQANCERPSHQSWP